MKTPLGKEIDLGPGHIVLDWVPAPAKWAQQPPPFSAHVYCGHGRPSQLLLSSCVILYWFIWYAYGLSTVGLFIRPDIVVSGAYEL